MEQEVTKRLLVKNKANTNFALRCSVISALKLFATKWKPCILCYLHNRSMRYNELYRIIPNISRKMLSDQLRELETDGMITRIQYDKKLQRVEYNLSNKGMSIMPVLHQIQDWGLQHIENVLSIDEMIAETVVD